MSRHEDLIRLGHMRDHAAEAVRMVEGRARGDLGNERMLTLALTHLVEIVGEAATRVSPNARSLLTDIPWPKIIGTRNRLVHGYDDIDLDILWDTLQNNLPPLIRQLDEGIDLIKAEREK